MFGNPDTAMIHFASILTFEQNLNIHGCGLYHQMNSVVAHYHKDAGTLTLF